MNVPNGLRTHMVSVIRWFLIGIVVFGGLADGATEGSGPNSASSQPMSPQERHRLREVTRDMFYHAYWAYMENAYPADELMPLSCKGRFRGLTPDRGDIDDCLGNFSLTLIDTLDTLVLLGDLEEFERAVRLVINEVSFDNDVIVSVFETNIRILGGLLSAHILANYLQQRDNIMPWYRGELLTMAKDVGERLLPAFNTTTGIPYARINLRYGLKSQRLGNLRETCTACAGSMILEMAALSRLTGDIVFEQKAQAAMDALWRIRHRSSDLMGTILNVHSGDWIRKDSGVGAGIDSYYEYCLKAYILLGDDKYLVRFNKHYNAVMKYISQGPMLLDVQMHRPYTISRNYMDALLAFWPGLQVLKGDLKPAVETHEMLYQVIKRHTFLPEAFTTDFQVHWGNHPLRPEFLESTYFLYTATNDPYYLEVGRTLLDSLQQYARVPCGYAAVNDVRTRKHEDRMDSFFLSETLKYLYLLFSDPHDLPLDLNEFIFTTEGHLLPLTLSGNSSGVPFHATSGGGGGGGDVTDVDERARTCPSTLQLFPETVRKPLENLVVAVCPKNAQHSGAATGSNVVNTRTISALKFSVTNPVDLKIIAEMGINVVSSDEGRFQLVHSVASAKSPSHAEKGFQFMRDMAELARSQAFQSAADIALTYTVSYRNPDSDGKMEFITAGGSQFGRTLTANESVSGRLMTTVPRRACADLNTTTTTSQQIEGRVLIIERGDCLFVEKVRRAQNAGASAVIIHDPVVGDIDNHTTSSSSVKPPTLFTMSGDGVDDVSIPAVFVYSDDARQLLTALKSDPRLDVTVGGPELPKILRARKQELIRDNKRFVRELHRLSLAYSTVIQFDLPKTYQRLKFGNFYGDVVGNGIIVYYNLEEYDKDMQELLLLVWNPLEDKSEWPFQRFNYMTMLVERSRKMFFVSNTALRQIYNLVNPIEDSVNYMASEMGKIWVWFLHELNTDYMNKRHFILAASKIKDLQSMDGQEKSLFDRLVGAFKHDAKEQILRKRLSLEQQRLVQQQEQDKGKKETEQQKPRDEL